MASVAHRFRPVEELDDLYRAHAAQVRGICGSILRDRQEAEDAAQQVFVSAFRALLGGTEPRDPGAWLARIARNESWARARRRQTVPLHPELQDAAQEDPATLVARRGELAGIWRAIESLPESQRDVLLLREVRGLSYDELVTDLELTHPSVRSLLNRARRTLRTQLQRGGAALTGAPWLNLVGRLFGDGPSPALSSASRTAAVGLGALTLTGAAALVPGNERTPHPRPAPAAPRVASAGRPVRSVTAAAAALAPERRFVVARTPIVQTRADRHSGGGGSGESDDSTSVRPRSGESTSSGSDSHGGPGPSGSSDDGGGSGSGTTSSSSGDGGDPGPSTVTAPTVTPVLTGTTDGDTSGGTSGPDGSTSSGSSGSNDVSGSTVSSGSDGDSTSIDGGSGSTDGH